MNNTFESTIVDCLDALDRGESADAILARHPAQLADLGPILAAAAGLAGVDLAPARATQAAARRDFLTAAAAERDAAPTPVRPARPSAWWRRRPMPAIAGMAAGVALVIALGVRSGPALPGDRLYPLKLAVESGRMALTWDEAGRSALYEALNQRRIKEVKALIAAGREAEVGFAGRAEPLGGGRWVVAGLVVRLAPTTQILGDLNPGEHVHLSGRLVGGRLLATTVICLDDLPNWSPALGATPDARGVPTAAGAPGP